MPTAQRHLTFEYFHEAELIYAKRFTKKQLEEHKLQDREDVRLRFATVE